MARTLTGLNPRREQRRQEIILDRITTRYQRRIANEIARTMRAAARNVKEPGLARLKHVQNMTALLTRLWNETGVDMSNHIAGQEKRGQRFSVKREEITALTPTEIADSVMRFWMNTQGAVEITKITDTTMRDIRQQIDAGITAGLSEIQIANNLRAVAPYLGGSRSQTIARTESHAAANVSAQATAQATGLKMVREWVASSGERTRKTHRDADGQRVGMDEPFTVGGVRLRYPGDQQAGSPRETINCRCAVAYVLAE